VVEIKREMQMTQVLDLVVPNQISGLVEVCRKGVEF
jgi:hypothetical protein